MMNANYTPKQYVPTITDTDRSLAEGLKNAAVLPGSLSPKVTSAATEARWLPFKPLFEQLLTRRLSMRQIARQLEAMDIKTARGKSNWSSAGVGRALLAAGLRPRGRWG